MKVWLPYTRGGSGSDVSTEFLAAGLRKAGHDANAQAFPHKLQYFPWWLNRIPAPHGTDLIITNTWNGLVFHRRDAVNVTVERLFVLDPAYHQYRTVAQSIFHNVLVRHFVRRSVETSDACVAVSQYSAQALGTELGLPKPRTILNAVDTGFFTPAAPDKRPSLRGKRPFRLLFVGNFSRRKGADIVVDVMRELGRDYELYFTSGLRLRTQGAFPENMHCLGRLNLEEVRDAYRDADALLFPSRLEGLPRTVMEALACGTPVVGSDATSIPEAVTHGVNGYLCPLNDPRSFAEAVRALAKDTDLWTRMAAAARETAERVFSLDRMVSEYLSLAEELAERRTVSERGTP